MGCWKSLNNFVTIEPYMIFFFSGQVFSGTALQELIYQKLCRQNYNVSECTNLSFEKGDEELQGTTSTWVMYGNIANTAPAVLSIMFLSGYSYKHGIRFVMFLPAICSAISAGWSALNTYYMSWPIELSLFSPLLVGLGGYYSAPLMAVTSYVVRDSTSQSLGSRIGFIEFGVALGALVAALTVGVIMQYTAIIYVFLINFVISVLMVLDLTFRLREPEQGYFKAIPDSTFREKVHDLLSFEAAWKYIKVLVRKRENSLRSHLHLMTLVFLIGFCSENAVTDVLYIYVTKTLGHTEVFYSILYGVGGGTTALGTTFGLYIITRILKWESITITVFGLITVAINSGVFAYGDHAWCLYIGAVFRFAIQYIPVGLRIYSSKIVEESEVSSVLGYVASVQCISSLVGTLLFNGLYPIVLPYWPGWIYMLGAFMSLSVIPIATYVQRSDRANGVHF